jgi:recombination protein RecR
MSSGTALPLIILSEQFAKLPGIGMKTAQRLAYHVMRMTCEDAEAFAEAIKNVHGSLKECSVCHNFTERDICPICNDPRRDRNTICVVELPKDIESFEKTGEYHGVYHVLHGLLSPMNGVLPEDLRIKELLLRVTGGASVTETKSAATTTAEAQNTSPQADNIQTEVIMAMNPTVEGEATAMYLAKLLKPFGVKVSRLALGIPVGASLEYTDSVTLFRALENRNEL